MTLSCTLSFIMKDIIPPDHLLRFLHCVEEGYKKNPYHNSTHAADVLQTMHVLLHRGGLVPGYADPMTLMACYLAAIIHDFEHVGMSNDFLINTCDPLVRSDPFTACQLVIIARMAMHG